MGCVLRKKKAHRVVEKATQMRSGYPESAVVTAYQRAGVPRVQATPTPSTLIGLGLCRG